MFGGVHLRQRVLLGRIAGFYGFSIAEAERQTPVAEFVRTKLPRNPTLGDRIRFENIELVVREMNGKRITRIGLEPDPDERGLDFMSGSSPPT
jgi:potassium/hydrogen antiporter